MYRSIEPWQIKRIGIMRKQVGIEDEDYRAMLDEYSLPGKDPVTSCKQLNYYQALDIISALEGKPESQRNPTPAQQRNLKPVATKAQLRMLKFYSLACGIHYAPFKSWVDDQGEVREGDAIRVWLKERFDRGQIKDAHRRMDLPIPEVLLRFIYGSWLNRTSNRFLNEGGFRRMPKDDGKLYYQELTPDECEYLINRYREMHNVLYQQNPEVQLPASQERLPLSTS